jgi:exopolysaccharide production protein ExoZ
MSFYLIFAGCLFLPMRGAVLLACCALIALVCSTILSDVEALRVLARPLILEFGVGCLIGLAKCEGLSVGRPASLVMFFAALALFLVYPRYDLVAREDWLRVLLWGLPAALVVAGMTVGPSVVVVRWNPLPLLGAASYAIYLTHWIVAAVMGGPWNGYPISTLVGSVCAGIIFYQCVEQPLLKFMRGSERGWRVPAPIA